MSSVRDQLKSFSGTAAGVRPIPCPDCPVPGVFVAKLSAASYLTFTENLSEARDDPGNTNPAAAGIARRKRVGIRLLTAAVDDQGRRLFDTEEQALALDAEVALPILELFDRINGLSEKKSPPPNSPPAG